MTDCLALPASCTAMLCTQCGHVVGHVVIMLFCLHLPQVHLCLHPILSCLTTRHTHTHIHVHVQCMCTHATAGVVFKEGEWPGCVMEVREFCLRHVREIKLNKEERERRVL